MAANASSGWGFEYSRNQMSLLLLLTVFLLPSVSAQSALDSGEVAGMTFGILAFLIASTYGLYLYYQHWASPSTKDVIYETLRPILQPVEEWTTKYILHLRLIYRSNLFPVEENTNLLMGRYFFWLEKGGLILDYLQLMGLYWVTANPWPIPYPMVKWMQWFTYFNLDYFSSAEGGALNGETGNIDISRWGTVKHYGSAYVLPVVFILFSVMLSWYLYDRFYCEKYGIRGDVYRSQARTAALWAINVLYLPVGIAVGRLYYCEEVTNAAHKLYGYSVLSADTEMLCWSGAHLGYFTVYSFVYLPCFFGLPYLLYKYTADNIVYSHAADHEKRLQAWEVTHMMCIDTHFMDNQVWVIAPYSLPAAYMRVWITVYKAVLLVLYVAVRGDGTNGAEGGNNAYKTYQSGLFWLATAVFLSRFVFFNTTDGLRGPKVAMPPYRVKSSNVVFYLFALMLFSNSLIGVSNAWGVVNAVTVNSNQTILLMCTTFGGLAALFFMLVSIFSNPFALWPSNRTLHRIQQNRPFAAVARRWIRVLYRANKIKMLILTQPPEIADVRSFESVIRALRSCWLEARYKGSLFDLILQECLEELIINHSLRAERFCRQDAEWDTVYEEAVSYGVFEERKALLRLMSPIKRRILNKLLALRLLQQISHPLESDLLEALHDSGLQQAYKNIQILERRTVSFLEKVRREDENVDTDAVMASLSGKASDAKAVLSVGDALTLQKRVDDTEELLTLWEQIIAALEEGLDSNDAFSQKIFTGDKLEKWYSYRDQLMELLSEAKSRGNTPGFTDPALAGLTLEDEDEDEDKEDKPFSFADMQREFYGTSIKSPAPAPASVPELEPERQPLVNRASAKRSVAIDLTPQYEPESKADAGDGESSVGTAESYLHKQEQDPAPVPVPDADAGDDSASVGTADSYLHHDDGEDSDDDRFHH